MATTAERVLAAYTGRKINPARSAAAKKTATRTSWKKLVGSKAKTQGGNPYWNISNPKRSFPSAGKNYDLSFKPKEVTALAVRAPDPRVKSVASGTTSLAKRAKGTVQGVPAKTGKSLGLGQLLKSPKFDAGLTAALLLYAALGEAGNQMEEGFEAKLQTEALQAQGRMASPESFYLNDAMERSKTEEQALMGLMMSKLSGGGVIGPSLAQGEYSIGG